ncbi:vWA domain-containing protein [Capilliphycus salinus ALCB114379]|uniref:vWA domain-containing protein n=1 Tax=Capilliphycus salinus TaxID=2768948 RepID=UPI0039A5991B
MTNPQGNPNPAVDLVIVIDTSPSMKDEAQALSQAASVSIKAAASSCPSDLRVAWFGVEGTWNGTNFNRTIRDYLLKVCKVSESQIRARKRGELPSAGAQEDGARAIEDIANHFDWRPGAARAIFYLGDEALEGGGSEVKKEDIEAANQAIKAAKNQQVKVHTYFGTSKSKNREELQQEFARVAKGTGGQSFTPRNSLKGFTAVLESVICGSRNVAETSDSVTDKKPVNPIAIGDLIGNLSFDSFARDAKTDIVCVSPVRTIVRREEEIILIRKVRKEEVVDASPACPVNTNQVSPSQS